MGIYHEPLRISTAGDPDYNDQILILKFYSGSRVQPNRTLKKDFRAGLLVFEIGHQIRAPPF